MTENYSKSDENGTPQSCPWFTASMSPTFECRT
jgi:hypothetical protein